MFQFNTFKSFGIKYETIAKYASDEEILSIICDKDIQTEIAYHMILDGIGSTSIGWKNCWIKQNIDIFYN